jgi:ureidoglycolate lyase
MSRTIHTKPLTVASFSPYGNVLQLKESPDKLINQGLCGRHHDLAALDFSDGRAGISLFDAEPRNLPYRLDMMERHPAGSQAFIPMSMTSYLVIVAPDADGMPGQPEAFLTKPGQGINLHRNTWHGVLPPLQAPGLFAVIDRIGDGDNLQEHWLETPYEVTT